jgi:hypothetical protein
MRRQVVLLGFAFAAVLVLCTVMVSITAPKASALVFSVTNAGTNTATPSVCGSEAEAAYGNCKSPTPSQTLRPSVTPTETCTFQNEDGSCDLGGQPNVIIRNPPNLLGPTLTLPPVCSNDAEASYSVNCRPLCIFNDQLLEHPYCVTTTPTITPTNQFCSPVTDADCPFQRPTATRQEP